MGQQLPKRERRLGEPVDTAPGAGLGAAFGPQGLLAEWAWLTMPRPGPVDPATSLQCGQLREELRTAAACGYGIAEITECMLAHMWFGHPDDGRVSASPRAGGGVHG
ncbi:hypothetical protein SUDANB120_02567 [Streptomyces sp. enrichment culture]|uniref:hypothetical protein n=1 Tax=Streptomyces sp. enrichment culture TaxID=1795815 RepID=UPI003F56B805